MAIFLDGPSSHPSRWRTSLLSALLVCALGVVVSPQVQLDVCGCKNSPASLGSFDTADPATYPPGTMMTNINIMEIPLPPDGVMVFNSLNLVQRPQYIGYGLTVRFIRNAANTPVTLLVSGNVNIATSVQLVVTGDNGVTGSTNDLGKGALGGPGGFRGADGGYQLVNFGARGGTGLGPGGGAGGTDTYYNGGHGAGATFLGAPDLLPLVGGSGGGGGASTEGRPGCSGGGGGGGGGALLLGVNGTLTLDGQIIADGGNAGNWADASCSSSGGGGSGGAVRVLATTINGSGQVYARARQRRHPERPDGIDSARGVEQHADRRQHHAARGPRRRTRTDRQPDHARRWPLPRSAVRRCRSRRRAGLAMSISCCPRPARPTSGWRRQACRREPR